MDTLEIPFLIGFGQNPITRIPEDEAQRILATGFNSLRVRQYISLAEDPLAPMTVESIVIAFLGVCMTAQNILSMVRVLSAGGSQVAHLHQGKHMYVVHTQLEPGIHEFIGLLEQEEGVSYMINTLNFSEKPISVSEEINLSQLIFDQVTELIRDDRVLGAEELLKDEGIETSVSHSLINSITTAGAQTIFSAITLPPKDEEKVEAFILLESPTLSWRITIRSNGDDLIQLCPINKESCATEANRLLDRASQPNMAIPGRQSDVF